MRKTVFLMQPFTVVSSSNKDDAVFRVEKLKFLDPTSALHPGAIAMASNNVDVPLPFSPFQKVTELSKVNFFRLISPSKRQ